MSDKQSKWESVDYTGETERLKVPGGWLYKYEAKYSDDRQPTMVFVPDVTPQSFAGFKR